MKNKKGFILIPALAMLLAGCKQPETPPVEPPVETTVHPESVTLDKTSLQMDLGAEATLTPTVAPVNASDTSVTWSSSNADVVEVSNRGKLTAKAVGEATITVTTVDGGITATCVVTVTMPKWGDADHPISVATALAQAETDLTTAKATTPSPIYVVGYVTAAANDNVDATTGTKYASNILLADNKDEADASKKLLVYSANYNANKAINAIYPGDKVVISGYLMQYAYNATDTKDKWKLEVTAANNVNPLIESCEVGKNAVTLGAHDNAEVTGLPTAAVNNGSSFEFVVTPASGYNIVSVKCNGNDATPVAGKENTYSGKVVGPTSVIVETVQEGVTVLTKEIVSPNSGGNLTGNGVNDGALFGLDGHFKVEGTQGSASTNVGLNAQIRLNAYYNSNPDANKKGKNNRMKISGVGITFTSVVLTVTQNDQYLQVLADGEPVTGDQGTYVINGKSFELVNAYPDGTAKTQIYITKIVMNYTEDERIAATALDVDKTEVNLHPELSERVTATVSPENSNDIVEWSSSDTAVATVVEGKITAIAVGTATITAKTIDFTKTITVNVTAFPTYENLTGKTFTPKAEYVDADGKGLDKNPCVLAGYVTEFTNAYGNGWLRTLDGVRVQLYNTFDITGKIGYKDMTDHKPVAGDFVILEGENVNYNGPELKNGKFLQVNDYKFELPAVTAIAAKNAAADLEIGKTFDAKANITVTPEGADASAMTFASDNTAVATVDANGVVTGVAAGTAKITATLGELPAAEVTITVKEAAPVGAFELGAEIKFDGTCEPDPKNGNSSTWTSNGYTMVIDKNTASTDVGNTSYFGSDSSKEIRLYKNQKITFNPAAGKTIVKVELDCSKDVANFTGSTLTNCAVTAAASSGASLATPVLATLTPTDGTQPLVIVLSAGSCRLSAVRIYVATAA